MFTSGSTGTPKGTITTHRMLASNQAMLSAVWPELARQRPIVVDWLPWSHCFGGSHTFGMILHNGGSLYVDGGRPAPGAFETTVANVRDISPNAFFSVPRGVALLVERFHADATFAASFNTRDRFRAGRGPCRDSRQGPERHAGILARRARDARRIRCRRLLSDGRCRAARRSGRRVARDRLRRSSRREFQVDLRHVGQRRGRYACR
jgi:hypothetical protein